MIDDALRLGDPATVVEVLSVAHNPLLGPQHTARRLSMAESMITRAAYIGTGVLPLMAWCWRTVDLFLSGDSKAPQSLAAPCRCRSDPEPVGDLHRPRDRGHGADRPG